ncbi:MAG: RNA polymerase subunit sigma-70 [Rhodospirillales bacterium CG15_BIG_FIL_POST_REV_8_21_14_020_66_15]|nr:MAG: RNA polymerase subunit sigma-70 [Rhodospirillales bacterium CG15_BIG_FIL_POST_REV_8_21_14_020_66_15]
MSVERDIEALIPSLRRFARALCRDAHLADDLVQDTLERALSRLFLWRRGSNLRAWMFTILRNLFINGRRTRYAPAATLTADQWEVLLVHLPEQPARMEALDLLRALDRLTEDQREVLLLVGLEGLTYDEAARVLDVPAGTVMSRLSRGREALRRLLDRDDPPKLREVTSNDS